MPNSKGIVMFAHNNDEIDYFRLAVINALLIQKHMKLSAEQITIVTDKHSYNYSAKKLGNKLVSSAVGNIVQVEKDVEFKYRNMRLYKDTSQTAKQLSFYNVNRCDVYDLSPYDETILIDADYLIFSDALNQCWGHNNELMMNWEYHDVMQDRVFDNLARVSPLGISMYWATVVYFRKSDYAESFFDLVKHVRDNQEYYHELYRWYGRLYRNDYSFSIAAHTLGGFRDKQLPQLPVKLYKTFENDDVHQAQSANCLVLFLEKLRSPGDFVLTRWQGVDLHVMNKWAINRVSDSLMRFVVPNSAKVSKKTTKKRVSKKSVRKKSTVKKTTAKKQALNK
jgi:hypothetical protein